MQQSNRDIINIKETRMRREEFVEKVQLKIFLFVNVNLFQFGFAVTNADYRDSVCQVCDRPLELTKEDLHWLHVHAVARWI